MFRAFVTNLGSGGRTQFTYMQTKKEKAEGGDLTQDVIHAMVGTLEQTEGLADMMDSDCFILFNEWVVAKHTFHEAMHIGLNVCDDNHVLIMTDDIYHEWVRAITRGCQSNVIGPRGGTKVEFTVPVDEKNVFLSRALAIERADAYNDEHKLEGEECMFVNMILPPTLQDPIKYLTTTSTSTYIKEHNMWKDTTGGRGVLGDMTYDLVTCAGAKVVMYHVLMYIGISTANEYVNGMYHNGLIVCSADESSGATMHVRPASVVFAEIMQYRLYMACRPSVDYGIFADNVINLNDIIYNDVAGDAVDDKEKYELARQTVANNNCALCDTVVDDTLPPVICIECCTHYCCAKCFKDDKKHDETLCRLIAAERGMCAAT